MMLVARTQKQRKKKRFGGKKKGKKGIIIPTMNAIRGMDRKKVLNSPLNKFLILAFKIYS